MIDWDAVSKAETDDVLREAKLWLFQENIRLENERRELAASQKKFLEERVQLQKELDELNRRTVMERKRLREENLFFEKKMAILQDGFRQLDEDRRSFEKQKSQKIQKTAPDDVITRMFSGITNPLALRKRYKELAKIFHPDNTYGDEELLQMINREYLRRKGDC